DVDRAVGELGVDRVAAAAEVDEVQERQMLLELLRRNRREAREQLADRDVGVLVLAARGEEEREQRLEDGEPLGRDRPGRTLARVAAGVAGRRLRRGLGRTALVPVAHAAQRRGGLA